jgi:hypothetical protein
MTDINERSIVPMNESVEVQNHTADPVENVEDLPVDEVLVEEHNGEFNGAWRTAAGRKGALRVHQLIQAGKKYEEEHGLKSGRQRLRQLIELGKLYEHEHGNGPAEPEKVSRRLSKMEREDVVSTLLECLIRMAKPSFRDDLERIAAALKTDGAQAA